MVGNAGVAGADLVNGPITLGTADSTGTVTPGMPYSSGQSIDVTVAANSTMNAAALTGAGISTTSNFFILECTDTNGTLPSAPTNCEAATVATTSHGTDGSFNATGANTFSVEDLPNAALGSATMVGKCDVAPNTCVLGVFSENPWSGPSANPAAFTTPHLFSAAFNVDVPAGDSGDTGVSPGDGSAPAVAPTSGANSTIAASPTTVVADGSNKATVTVSLLDTSGHPVTAAKMVTLSQGAGSHSTITVNGTAGSTATTDGNGQAVFTVSDSSAEAVTYTATDTTDSVPLTHQASVTFSAPVVTQSNCSISAASNSVPQGGSTTVTVTLEDQGTSPQPIAGKVVMLTQGGGHSVIKVNGTVALTATTNSGGQAVFTVSDSTAETVTYSATDTSDTGVSLAGLSVGVTFGTLTVSATDSTVTTSTPIVSDTPSNGPQPTGAVTVTLLDGSSPVAGKSVTLHASSGNVVISPGSQVAGVNGVASFTVSDTTAEVVTFNAVDVTDSNLAIVATTQVSFQTPAASSSKSSMTVNPTSVPADGVTPVSLTVTIEDQFGNPLAGKTVTVITNVTGTSTPSATAKVIPAASSGTNLITTTNGSGQIAFDSFDTTAESVTYVATDTNDSVVVNKTLQATFTPGVPQVSQSSVQASPSAVPADGTTASTITVTMEDHNANAVPGVTVTLTALSGSSVISPTTGAMTDASGKAAFTVTDSTGEAVQYRATDTSDNLPLVGEEVTVTFGSPPPILPVVADSDIVASRATVPADGHSSASVEVILNDANGLPLSGKSVALFPSSMSTVASPSSATTDSNGIATFTVTDKTVESVTFNATDVSDDTPLTGLTVTVTFTPATPVSTGAPLNKPIVGMAATADGGGYWLVASDGGIFSYGDAVFYGSTGAITLNKPIVGMAATPDGKGYWLVASDGGIFNYGDAVFYGSAGAMTLNKPIVGMAATADGGGYWLVASDGGIFSYGDAVFYGSTGAITLNKPIVGMAATPDGKGYWLVASDGGIFNYGDAVFYGSAGAMTLNKPIVGMAATADGGGYWLVASDGGIFSYGDAVFYGSTGAITLNKPIVGMAATPDGKGYWLVASDGGIFNYGDAVFYGSAG